MNSVKVETDTKDSKLEKYLNDIYEKECVFKTGSEEIDFIQTGIETLTQNIVDLALEHFKEQTAFLGNPGFSESLDETFRKLRDSTCPNDIIKVGSFYEGTKNNFPDEFDFIFLLYSSENVSVYRDNELRIPDHSRKLMVPLTNAILELARVTERNKDSLQYVHLARKLYFDKYMYAKGPAAKLRFIYETINSCTTNYIHVDLVPAVKESGSIIVMAVDTICPLKEFRNEILSTGSYLFVNALLVNYTFTETEVRFMKSVLSKNHLKVYRILKYLINGHGDDEELQNYLHEVGSDDRSKLYSSYRIKAMMIYHHYKCTNGDPTTLGSCVLEILENMSKYSDIDRFPKLVNKTDTFKTYRIDATNPQTMKPFFILESGEYKFCLLSQLQSMLNHLKLMKSAEGSYDYERDKVKKSVTKMYLDDQTTEVLLYERVKSLC